MVVSIWTMTDTQFLQTSVREQESQVQATAPAVGAVVPLAGVVDPSAQGEFGSFASNGMRIFASGEKICAVQYRQIR